MTEHTVPSRTSATDASNIAAGCRFFLGTHMTNWLWADQPARWPWFVSHRRLARLRSYRPATAAWALDSGGFTELSMFGGWRTSPAEYVDAVRRYRDEIGRLEWAAPQDWMCEPFMLAKTGLTVADHQRHTIDNLLELRTMAPDLPFVPVIQGWQPDDYRRHVDAYQRAGFDLTAEPTVGIGSVCRRGHLDVMADLIAGLHDDGLALHGFGLKADAIVRYRWALRSADSLAWSYAGRLRPNLCRTGHRARSCSNCRPWAETWAERVTSAETVGFQMTLRCTSSEGEVTEDGR